ncbi:hypothetical protein CHO01_26310 [Cellulomonas hominis]|uniref:Putative endonuclease Z1 domain-containing protein n=1 Tax=Cellulomonas hominis TaxID=156981 RepID=A0A511FE47_9CELL|nr:Z1 domain-containing protein [Cellulomonas hominis]MBB5472095.1 hypothetical protein [Cellulomonas hominis]NKY05451.1 hypothetical protein [Cellulomonas hominis]GEL47515.1 hypothetical protein CHO01_26310 [Cellulomonas hominis]
MTEPFGGERLVLADDDTSPATWWSVYVDALASSGIGAVSRAVIEADAEHILRHGILGAGEAGSAAWPASRVRTGVVMGAVQSGKTASMMAVVARALDAGVDAIVILGGTRTALWAQTFERVVEQFGAMPEPHLRRLLVPREGALGDGDAGVDARSAYRVTKQLAQRAITRRRPMVAVVMKNVAHIAAMAETLQEAVYPAVEAEGRPFHLLVLDDEADDSSVVGGLDPDVVRQVPRRILDLWESRRRPGETTNAQVYASYVAYTATPQANFLQDPGNPLSPRDFVASLRAPGAEGDPDIRSSSYRVPEGAPGWYTGGDVYYRLLDEVPLCVPTDTSTDDSLIDTVRGYLVASALRLLRAPGRLGPSAARAVRHATRAEAAEAAVKPMSMLVHPSSAKDRHFDVAERILAWSDGSEVERQRADGARALGRSGVAEDLETNRPAWIRWLEDYQRSAEIAREALELPAAPTVPPTDQWPEVERLVLDEIVPGTSVAVINSDENADDRPRFGPVLDADGMWRSAPNLSTIFVSGNVMSRGLTLEGLTTTYFSRRSDEPLADTQMQMQRWFGYRGSYIDLCRVLLGADQLDLFRQYHENDEALRRDVLAAMGAGGGLPSVTVLQGKAFKATGKISNLRSVPVWPGPKPFVRHVNPAGEDKQNQELIAGLFSEAVLKVPSATGDRGLLLERRLDLYETADLLDSLVYAHHGPGQTGAEADRWRSVENHARLDEHDPAFPLFRAPAVKDGVDLGLSSPYAIAAYLRLWAAALDRAVPGMVTTDESPLLWRLLDLDVKREQQPTFSVGVRFGGGDPVEGGPLAGLPAVVRPMRRDVDGTTLASTWGSRNVTADGIRGDEHFDFVARGEAVRTSLDGSRPAGSDGLVLFHVVEMGSTASVAVGVVLPLGGPDHVEAQRGGLGV